MIYNSWRLSSFLLSGCSGCAICGATSPVSAYRAYKQWAVPTPIVAISLKVRPIPILCHSTFQLISAVVLVGSAEVMAPSGKEIAIHSKFQISTCACTTQTRGSGVQIRGHSNGNSKRREIDSNHARAYDRRSLNSKKSVDIADNIRP